jgi:hypothetical protein
MKRYFAIALLFGLTATSAALAQLKDCLPFGNGPASSAISPCTVKALVEKQVARTFEEKFSLVTSNIAFQSQSNLSELKKAIPLAPDADSKALELDNDLVIVHATNQLSAAKILSSGSLLSLDELVRRKIVPLEAKIHAKTVVYSDGEIGEQDVIYFALQPRSEEGYYGFGEVTFYFDKKAVLSRGYFTVNAFQMGTVAQPIPGPEGLSKEQMDFLINPFRAGVFSGWEAYIDLLKLSYSRVTALQNGYWLGLSARARAIAEAYHKATNDAVADANARKIPFKHPSPSEEMRGFEYCEVFEKANGLPRTQCDPTKLDPLEMNEILNNLRLAGETKPMAEKIISAFNFFPVHGGSGPLLVRTPHWFWEVKVPREMPLLPALQGMSFATEVKEYFSNTDANGKTTNGTRINKLETAPLEAVIRSYAAANGLRVDKTIHPKSKVVFMKFRRPQ